jgi:hypothetical protein
MPPQQLAEQARVFAHTRRAGGSRGLLGDLARRHLGLGPRGTADGDRPCPRGSEAFGGGGGGGGDGGGGDASRCGLSGSM